LRDFTVDHRVWLLTGVSLVIGTGAAALAVILLRAIAFATNFFYYHRLSLAMVGPAGSPLSPQLLTLVPVAGGLLVGLMAYFGSDKIRGHGIPEAIEAILLNGARVDPKVAVLKPLSAAIAIGSGGPFGAEGPIIMTGGAFGSLVAQCLNFRTPNGQHCWLPVPLRGCPQRLRRRLPRFCLPLSCFYSSGVRVRWSQ
jgi:H+/Cl- antiporter ClcA